MKLRKTELILFLLLIIGLYSFVNMALPEELITKKTVIDDVGITVVYPENVTVDREWSINVSFINPSSKSYLVYISLSVADPYGKIHIPVKSSIVLRYSEGISLSYTPELAGAHKFNLTFKMKPTDEETVVNGTFYASVPAWFSQAVQSNLAETFASKEDIKKLEEDIKRLDSKIDQINNRIDQINNNLNTRIDGLYNTIINTATSVALLIATIASLAIDIIFHLGELKKKIKKGGKK
jgi:hypothetical protein